MESVNNSFLGKNEKIAAQLSIIEWLDIIAEYEN
jgi:hypothetical protein